MTVRAKVRTVVSARKHSLIMGVFLLAQQLKMWYCNPASQSSLISSYKKASSKMGAFLFINFVVPRK